MSTKDPRKAKQFATRKEAVAAAKAIGWRVNDATAVEVMGFKLYAISDEHLNLLTPSEVFALMARADAERKGLAKAEGGAK